MSGCGSNVKKPGGGFWKGPLWVFGAPTHTHTHTRCSPVTLDFPRKGPVPLLCNGAAIYMRRGGEGWWAGGGGATSGSFSQFYGSSRRSRISDREGAGRRRAGSAVGKKTLAGDLRRLSQLGVGPGSKVTSSPPPAEGGAGPLLAAGCCS